MKSRLSSMAFKIKTNAKVQALQSLCVTAGSLQGGGGLASSKRRWGCHEVRRLVLSETGADFSAVPQYVCVNFAHRSKTRHPLVLALSPPRLPRIPTWRSDTVPAKPRPPPVAAPRRDTLGPTAPPLTPDLLPPRPSPPRRCALRRRVGRGG